MANTDSISSTLDQDVWSLVLKSQQAESLLRCALSMIEELCLTDLNGQIFHCIQTIEVAAEKNREISYMEMELHILERVKALEGVRA